MASPLLQPNDDLFCQLALRLTVMEVAVAALIRAAPEAERASALFALATLETLSLDDRSGLPAPPGIAEYLRNTVGRLGAQAMGSDWRRYIAISTAGSNRL